MKMPPCLDDKLTKNALGMLKYAPLFFIANGYWMLSNMQIFDNVWNYIATSQDTMYSHHHVEFKVAQASPLLLMSIAAIALIVIQILFQEQLTEWGFAMSEKMKEIDEDLPKFFDAIKLT